MTEKHGAVRDVMGAALQGKKPDKTKLDKLPERVLLIDEVDVFLDPSFFGGVYRPCLPIGDERIAKLMCAIWANPTADPLELHEYAALFERLALIGKDNVWFAKSAVLDMQRTVETFKKSPQQRGTNYELIDGWVWYKLQDSLVRSDQLNYMYLTNCVYLYEHQRGSVTEEQLLDHGLYLHAVCGEFSYALLPSTQAYSTNVPAFYKFILGVTGTLDESRLSKEARALLRDEIHIQHMTYCPSMYGSTRDGEYTKSKSDYQCSPSESEHFIKITNEIRKRLKPTSVGVTGKRAVLVFFEELRELESYYNSTYFAQFKDAANRLTETSAKDPDERDSLVSKATRQGQITLATRAFGRGIDFIVDDDHMVICGGLHVLLTFFPRDVQEEVQIKGRTGRQGQQGSFSMVMRSLQLEDFAGDHATAADITAWEASAELYDKISEIRAEQAAADMQERLDKAEEAKAKHDQAAAALNAFQKRSDAKPLTALLKTYNFVGSSTTARTLMLLDITYSMNGLIEKTKSCIGQFFDRVQKVLDAEGVERGFELQIAGFSNYNVDVDQILAPSTWETRPRNLSVFLKDLNVRGGWGPEAIEVGLMHALTEHRTKPIDQIIVIGDAPANPAVQIADKREDLGEAYWQAQRPSWSPSGIPSKVATEVLRDIQAVKPVPIHCYHMKERAEESFEELAATAGGGTAQRLDVNSQAGAQLLTDAVCKQILSSLGGKKLQDAYERMKPSFNR